MTDTKTALATAAEAIQQATAAFDSERAALLASDHDALVAAQAETAALRTQLDALETQLFWANVDNTGGTEVTTKLQQALDAGMHIPAGRYLIDPLVSIVPKAGATLAMDPQTVLVLKPNGEDRYYGILINQPNVTVQGGQIAGDRDAHDYTTKPGTHEHGMGIGIVKGGDGAQVNGVHVSKCTGDGVCVGGGVTNIKLTKVVSTGNRRQGASITNASNVTAEDCEFTDTKGTSPECGVDVEPDAPNTARNITLRRCLLARNNKYGVNIFARVSDVTLEDCIVQDNVSCGVVTAGGNSNTVIKGGTIQRNGATGVKAQAGTAGISIDDVTFFDNYRTINDKDRVDFDAAGISTANYRARDILIDPTATGVSVGVTKPNHYA